MNYKTSKVSENSLSILGFGCMRLPQSKEKSEALVLSAVEKGINYFDTAYLYPGNEKLLGDIVAKNNLREKIFIATKLPQSSCNKTEDFDKYFTVQKNRLQTDYIDYYLMHNISHYNQWENLKKLGIKDWVAEKKKSKEILNIGFSYHGSQADFIKILDDFNWDFAQIQYNYININYQAGEKGLKAAAKKGIDVIIMEPLLGGKLATGLPKEAKEAFAKENPNLTPAQWGLNWLWNQPEVTVVLSGMNQQVQIDENVAVASVATPNMYSQKEDLLFEKVIKIFNKSYKIPCTGCNYCMPCPKDINIPACFATYNTSYAVGWKSGMFQYVIATGCGGSNPRLASDCIKCGKCEQHCPQQIKIRDSLKLVKGRFEILGLKHIAAQVRKFMKRGGSD